MLVNTPQHQQSFFPYCQGVTADLSWAALIWLRTCLSYSIQQKNPCPTQLS